ncbi:MAG: tetratricopeptide repeat protein [Isosphaerales bacterium]
MRRRWPQIIALATLLATGGLCWVWARPSAEPVKQGLDAYARGDWEAAAGLARVRLKADGNDVAALRLLARASVHLGRDPSAMAVYHRLGPQTMLADDLCLLGIALTRTGNRQGGLQVWEQARSIDPNHAETLFELTQAYSASDQLTKATGTGRRLASCSGWEGRAEALLGTILLARNDPAGAVTSWQRALEHNAGEHGGASTPMVPRTELARALLQTRRPAEARRQLQIILTMGPDPEAFWLMSRAYLQEGARTEALAAWEKAGSFRDDNPLVPEPAPFLGSAGCADCHPAIYQAQQGSRHARTFFRVSQLGDLDLPAPSFSDPAQPAVTHTLRRSEGGRLQQETQVEGQVLRAVVEYAFGSGDRGLTLVGHDDHGQARELRLSHYAIGAESCWDITFGHPGHPSEVAEYLGQPLSDDAVRRCFLCHVTDPRAVLEATGPLASDRGIGCEKCHGPGGNHEVAVKAEFPDLAIANPAMASGSPVVKLCAQCHSPRGRTVTPDDPTSVRFQGTTLTWSRCFTESKDALDCVTCHDPHRNVVTSTAHYEARCLSCHASAARSDGSPARARRASLSETSRQTPCPVDPTKGCIACHMPAVKNVLPHTFFTDHFIRVHRD